MQSRFAIAVLIGMSPLTAVAQGTKAEQEVRKFLSEYDKAVAGRDITFLERVLPHDYVYTGESGRMSDRTRVLKFLKQEKDQPTSRMNSLTHENVVVRVVGKMAVVTNDYVAEVTSLESPDATPHTDTGRHTAVFEKRGGRWMVIAEQDTEQPHDDKVMERQVLAAARSYNDLIQHLQDGRTYAALETGGDLAKLKRLLDDEYVCTSRDGEMDNSAQAVERYKTNAIRIEAAETSEQEVRAIDNGTAVETARVRLVGTNAGNPFDLTIRYTRTWVLRDRWRITAEHSSVIRMKS